MGILTATALIIFNFTQGNSAIHAETQNPESYPVSYLNEAEWKTVDDLNQGIQLKFPKKLTYQKQDEYFGNNLQKNVINIIDQNDPDSTRFNLKAIPFNVENKSTALSILENYLVSNVGIGPKNNQKVTKINGFEIAHVGYNPFQEGNENYFRVYSVFKKGTSAWIFTIGYTTSPDKKDALDFNNSNESNLYLKIITSFLQKNSKSKDVLNNIDSKKVDDSVLKKYKEFNSKFETNI